MYANSSREQGCIQNLVKYLTRAFVKIRRKWTSGLKRVKWIGRFPVQTPPGIRLDLKIDRTLWLTLGEWHCPLGNWGDQTADIKIFSSFTICLFWQKAPSDMFNWVLNATLVCPNEWVRKQVTFPRLCKLEKKLPKQYYTNMINVLNSMS